MYEEDYNLEANFNKSQIIDVIDTFRAILGEFNIPNSVWHIDPHGFAVNVDTNRPDSKMLYRLYQIPEIKEISLGIEPNSRIILVRVRLKRDWFMEKRHAASRRDHDR